MNGSQDAWTDPDTTFTKDTIRVRLDWSLDTGELEATALEDRRESLV
jgi:hypothetical protein